MTFYSDVILQKGIAQYFASLQTYHFIYYSLLLEYLHDCGMQLILCVNLT